MWKDNLVFCKSKSTLFFCTSIGVHKKPSRLSTSLYDQVNVTVGTSSTHREWVWAIPGQIILIKQVNIHVYTIGVHVYS